MTDLQQLLNNMNKNRSRKEFVKNFGMAKKAIEFQEAINQLNQKYDTSYYMTREGSRSFYIEGHREFGYISRRDGILGQDISLTIDLKDIDKSGSEHTIKMIVDNQANWIVFSLTKMRDLGLLDIEKGQRFRTQDGGNACRFCVWDLPELTNVVLYTSRDV